MILPIVSFLTTEDRVPSAKFGCGCPGTKTYFPESRKNIRNIALPFLGSYLIENK
jgi:hypothetical protein